MMKSWPRYDRSRNVMFDPTTGSALNSCECPTCGEEFNLSNTKENDRKDCCRAYLKSVEYEEENDENEENDFLSDYF